MARGPPAAAVPPHDRKVSVVALHPYPRGFLIHKIDSKPRAQADWSTIRLGNSSWMFTYEHLLQPEIAKVEDSDRWVLVHGLCLHAGLETVEQSPAQHLARMAARGEDHFLKALDYLGGRHIILLGDDEGFRVFHDATGMRSVYFSPGALMVSSHAHLINDICVHTPRSDEQGLQGAISGWDRTPFLGISSLLPNHFLDVADWSVRRFYPREVNHYVEWDLKAKVSAFRRMWDHQLDNLAGQGSKLVMSLTGGADSRTSLALSMDHVSDIETFTYTVKTRNNSTWSKSMALDKQIVDEIKQLVPVKHRYFFFGKKSLPNSQKIHQLLKKNTTQTHGPWLVPHYANAFPQEDVVHIRGNAYEIGRAYWGSRDWNDNLDNLERLYKGRTKKDAGLENEESRKADFGRGLKRWEYDIPLHGYHLLDLFYWEVRLGRWLAEILNETDIAFETCVPINVRSMIEISLSFSAETRATGFFFSELINSACPVLNFPGKNETRNIYEQIRDERAEAESLHSTENPIDMSHELQITTIEGVTRHQTQPDDSIYIPRNDFLAGTTVKRELCPAPVPGDLTFTVDSPYSNLSAIEHWHYQINVDGRPMVRWDGAERRRPVHITIQNVTPAHKIDIEIVALRDHSRAPSWESATRARIMNIVFTENHSVGGPTVATDVPGSVLCEHDQSVITVHVDDLHELSSTDFIENVPQRMNLVTKYCIIPFLIVRKGGSDSTITMCNGAVNQEQSGGKPVFQRSSWWREIDHHQIYFCDPATVGQNAVSLAWGQSSPDYWIVPDTARAVQAIANALGCADPAQRAYFGSSGGGFFALALLYHDPDSRALINNAQFDWTRWHAPGVNRLRARRLKSMLPSELRARYPLRTNVINLLSTLSRELKIDYWVNAASKHDREIDLPEFVRFKNEFPDITQYVKCHQYRDPVAGHNPLSKSKTLRILSGIRLQP